MKKTKPWWIACALLSFGLLECVPPAESEAETHSAPAATAGGEAPCAAKFQARRAYASFKEPPGENDMAIAMLETEEILSSLRAAACRPRPDLPVHGSMLDALEGGALIVTAITFITPELDVAEAVASEASYGDATAPEARSFLIRVRRAQRAQPTSYTAEGVPDEVPPQSWHITGLDLRTAR
jgi:hypothetical protein